MGSLSRALPDEFPIQKWEFNYLLLDVVILGGAGMGVLIAFGRRLLPGVSDWLLFPLGFLLIGLSQIPLNSVVTRTLQQREISIRRMVEGILLGTVVFAAANWFLR